MSVHENIKIRTEVMGFPIEMSMEDYVECVDKTLSITSDDSLKLIFMETFDHFQEDAEFTQEVAIRFSKDFTEWLKVSGIKEEDPEWVEEWKNHLKEMLIILGD